MAANNLVFKVVGHALQRRSQYFLEIILSAFNRLYEELNFDGDLRQ